MTPQASLFDQEIERRFPSMPLESRARVERDSAMAAVEEHAPDEWKTEAWGFLSEYLRTHQFMHVDELWDAGLPVPPELRALGALFNRAVRAGYMAKTDRYRPSVRSHLSPKVVWRSLLWNEQL